MPLFSPNSTFNNCSLGVTHQVHCSDEALRYCRLLTKRNVYVVIQGDQCKTEYEQKRNQCIHGTFYWTCNLSRHLQSMLDCPLPTCISPSGMSEVFVVMLSVFCFSFVLLVLFWYARSLRAGIAQSVARLATGWTVRGSNPGGGRVFRTRPDRPRGPPRLLYNGYRVFPGIKAAGAWRWPPNPSSAEVKG
jgi:hypothetical protein